MRGVHALPNYIATAVVLVVPIVGGVRPFILNSGHPATASACPFCVDTVAKVENRTSLKISQKPMFSRLSRCNAARADTKVVVVLGKTMWSSHRRCGTHQRF